VSRLRGTYYVGQTDRGCVHFLAEVVEGIFIWGAMPHWEKSQSDTLKGAAGALHIKKLEKLKPVDVPLFLLRVRLEDQPEPCISKEKS
jgi:hypothetical protein